MNDFLVFGAVVAFWLGQRLLKRFLRNVLPKICEWAEVPGMKKVNMTSGAFTTVNGNVFITNIQNDYAGSTNPARAQARSGNRYAESI